MKLFWFFHRTLSYFYVSLQWWFRKCAAHILVIGQVTMRWRSTHNPARSWSPGGRGCSKALEAWAKEAGTGHNPYPSSGLALCMNVAPIPLQREKSEQSQDLEMFNESSLISNTVKCHKYSIFTVSDNNLQDSDGTSPRSGQKIFQLRCCLSNQI